jgi:hypothetical protein
MNYEDITLHSDVIYFQFISLNINHTEKCYSPRC